MPAHTPGPWNWDVDESGFTFEVWGKAADELPRHVCEMFRFDELGREKGRDELEANARLIAAAPRMLEELSRLYVEEGAALHPETCTRLLELLAEVQGHA